MPKVNDIKAYWKELATKHGLDDETSKTLQEVLEKDSVRKAMTEGFKPLPDYSHDLDDTRARATEAEFNRLKTWHDGEKTKFDEYVKAEERLKQYETKFGKLDAEERRQLNNSTGMTKDEMETLLAERLSARDSAYMDLLEIRETHLGTFRKPLDVKSFEAAWKEHPEWGGSMKLAYKEFVSPETEKIRETEFTQKLQQKYDEGVRDGFTRRSLPVDGASKTFSPMFDRKEDVSKMSERDQESHSRNAFFEGLRDTKPA